MLCFSQLCCVSPLCAGLPPVCWSPPCVLVSPLCAGLPQVVLINAVKDVAKALSDLIRATKGAAGKPHDDPAMLQLKNSAKVRPFWRPAHEELPAPWCNSRNQLCVCRS